MINSLIFPKHKNLLRRTLLLITFVICRLMRLDAELTLGFDASCFGELPSENDSQSFSSVRHSADSRQSAWQLSIFHWIERSQERDKQKDTNGCSCLFVYVCVGLNLVFRVCVWDKKYFLIDLLFENKRTILIFFDNYKFINFTEVFYIFNIYFFNFFNICFCIFYSLII